MSEDQKMNEEDFGQAPEEQQPGHEAAAEAGQDETLTALEHEVARLRDALLRTRAEMDNMQKRAERQRELAHRYQHERIMSDLLPVMDGLDQGLENAAADDPAREGLELTHRLLVKILGEHGLEVLDPIGEPFNPQWHEAITMQPSDEAEPDSVLMVVQKGYRLGERVLRAARVIVARAP